MFNKRSPQEKFESAKRKHSLHVFSKNIEDVNAVLSNISDSRHLTKSQVWQGLKWKAEKPENYIPVKESMIIPGSRHKNSDGEQFARLSIQPDFASGNDIIVKEIVYVDERSSSVFFFGVPVDVNEANELGFNNELFPEKPALFQVKHAVSGSEQQPLVSWEMVRLCENSHNQEQEVINKNIRELVQKSKGTHIYLQTIRQFDELNRHENRELLTL